LTPLLSYNSATGWTRHAILRKTFSELPVILSAGMQRELMIFPFAARSRYRVIIVNSWSIDLASGNVFFLLISQ
jgi:hypothetical protein